MLSEMEAVIRTHPTKIAQGQMDSVENSIRILQEELAPILFKLSHKIETEGTVANFLHDHYYPNSKTTQTYKGITDQYWL